VSAAASSTARLTVRSPGSDQHFGFSVAASADGPTVVAGAPQAAVAGHQGQGAAYVFVRPRGGRAAAVELVASGGMAHEHFGSSVAVSASGAAIIVGAPDAAVSGQQDAGVAYVFLRPPGGWQRGATVKHPAAALILGRGARGDLLGTSVAVSGDGRTVIAGGYGTTVRGDPQQGAAYVFSAPTKGWKGAGVEHPAAELTASDGSASDFLGWAVAISRDGSTVVAGAPFAGRPVGGQGLAYVFVRAGRRWSSATQAAELRASNGIPGDALGVSVAASADGSTLAVGACCANVAGHRGQGAVYVFSRGARGWANRTQAGELTALDGAAGDNLGSSVAISPSGALVAAGAIGARVNGQPDQGAVYLFKRAAGGWRSRGDMAKLTAAGAAARELVGSSLALIPGTGVVAAGAPDAAVSGVHGAGAVYLLSAPALTPGRARP